MAWLPHVVIIGGGFGGLLAARAFKHAPVEVTLVDRHNHHVFQPLLYQVATAGLSPGDIASPIRWILRASRTSRVLLAEAQSDRRREPGASLDSTAATLDLRLPDRGGRRDALVLRPRRVGAVCPGAEDARRCAADARADAARVRSGRTRSGPRASAKRLLTFVIVGGGPTGVEMAGAIAEIAQQTLSDEFQSIRHGRVAHRARRSGPDRSSRRFRRDCGTPARKSLQKLGVEVREKTAVTRIEERRVWLGDERIEAHRSCGPPASPRRRSARRSACRPIEPVASSSQPDLSIPGHPDVFVAGDLASFSDRRRAAVPGVAQVAMQQAQHAARNVRPRDRGPAAAEFHYIRTWQHGDHRPQRGDRRSRAGCGCRAFPRWLLWLFIHIFWLIGFRNRSWCWCSGRGRT